MLLIAVLTELFGGNLSGGLAKDLVGIETPESLSLSLQNLRARVRQNLENSVAERSGMEAHSTGNPRGEM